ncbi:hypothetical protein EDD16DRAFT_1519934 [Pisolithus croceorrhizus]|nr:hypothetical protein EDD16DRAFT_1519934 [Pisolithus croceorrhizus]KAI6131842.1 hypothetical protein EV401DRAFT_1883840 [Pisolithus croceorrhizus]
MGARRPTLAKTLTSLEFEKGNGSMERKDDGKKVIWSLHHIMGGDPCCHAMFGVIIENTEVNLWFARRAVRPRAWMGPNRRVCIGGKVQYDIAVYTQGRSIVKDSPRVFPVSPVPPSNGKLIGPIPVSSSRSTGRVSHASQIGKLVDLEHAKRMDSNTTYEVCKEVDISITEALSLKC